ncbi:sporulation protein [Actinomadura sediminis]|uniref:Sporulation protein n=1 Tax=Actinomadura sediminis TaxID=1038904 RepID=A0ABW3ETC3_9ACTN
MAFRTFLSALGVNAPRVETIVDTPSVQPGDPLRCTVRIQGGGADIDIERLRLGLVVRAEDLEKDGSADWKNPYTVVEAARSGFRLRAGETITRPVYLTVPWDMPLTHERGRPIPGGRAAVRTELSIDNALDKGDFDEIQVRALPAQDMVFQIYEDLGFRLHEAEVKIEAEYWENMEDRRTSPYWQELDFFFPPAWNRGTEELETVLVTFEDELDMHPGGCPPLTLRYAEQDRAAWTTAIDRHIRKYWAPDA